MGASAHADSAKPMLDLWEIDVDGNTVLDDDTINATIQPFLGPQRSLDAVDHARDALEQVYRDHGYKTVAVTIPRQTAREGVVKLEVVESSIGHLNVIGSRYHSIDLIRLEASSLAEGKVPDFTEVQKDIVALNRDAELHVTPALKPGTTPGTVDVDLAVDDQLPLHGSLELNNRQSLNTTALRMLAAVSYDNLFQRGQSLSLSYQVAPENPADARVFFGSYLARFGRSPYSLLINGIKSDSNVATVGGASVIGRGEIVGLRFFVSLPGGDTLFPSLGIGADYKHFITNIQVGSQTIATPLTYVPLVAALNFTARDHSAVTQANFSINFASPRIGSSTADIDAARTYARGQFLSFKQNFSRLQPLPYRLQALVRLGSQVTDQPLISNEQFSAGGADTVRGYYESEALGDYGFTGGFELRGAPIPDELEWFDGFAPIDNLRLFAFVDGAELRLRNPTPEVRSHVELLSTGFGLSFRLFSLLEGNVDYARPLFDGPSTRAGDGRVLFRVSSSF